ncbi:YraN family protein [Prevotella sp. HUN102]|uniref:YraN family protein n=1 Tax=Prevotella sp. HUN102 TaxID=1392486 RepID=UPI00049040D6|nr:YraN family protein [Prevotella sp. HUN102]
MATHNELGAWGEELACEYLRQSGYRILDRNWKYGRRDLDIVAVENDVLVVAEVKTRRNERFTDADEAVNAQKIRSLSIAANAYVKSHCWNQDIRFDIITIVGSPDEHEVRHVKDAFLPFV